MNYLWNCVLLNQVLYLFSSQCTNFRQTDFNVPSDVKRTAVLVAYTSTCAPDGRLGRLKIRRCQLVERQRLVLNIGFPKLRGYFGFYKTVRYHCTPFLSQNVFILNTQCIHTQPQCMPVRHFENKRYIIYSRQLTLNVSYHQHDSYWMCSRFFYKNRII